MRDWMEIAIAIGEIMLLIGVLIGSVFFHEIGHLLAFRANNIDVETVSVGFPIEGISLVLWKDSQGTKYQITPLLILGYTSPTKEGQQIFEGLSLIPKIGILIAGPAFNFVLAIGLTGFYFLLKRSSLRKFPRTLQGIKLMSYINLILGTGNLVVVFPGIDGGRILQLLITPWLDENAVWVTYSFGFLNLILFEEKIYPWLKKKVYKLE